MENKNIPLGVKILSILNGIFGTLLLISAISLFVGAGYIKSILAGIPILSLLGAGFLGFFGFIFFVFAVIYLLNSPKDKKTEKNMVKGNSFVSAKSSAPTYAGN